jgi:hypothetical protein
LSPLAPKYLDNSIKNDNILIMKKLPIIAALAFSFCLLSAGCRETVYCDKVKLESAVNQIAERAYFYGQRDALTGNIRIKRDEANNCWRLVKTFWDNGNPTSIDISGIPDKEKGLN